MVLERRLARIGLAAAVLLLALIGTSTYRNAGLQSEASAWVTHTHRVVEALEAVVFGISEAESAVRGYAATRDDAYLEDLEPALASSKRGFVEARSLTRDNVRQQEMLRQLEPILDRRLTLLRERQTQLLAGAPPGIPYEHRALSKQIRGTIATAVGVEQELLVERTSRAAAHLETTRALSGLGMAASIGLVLFAFFFFDREMRQRRVAERRLGLLLELGELLQACRTPSEAFEVIRKFSPTFFPGHSGRVSLLRASRNALESQVHWGDESMLGKTAFEPDDCWALRRGQSHASRVSETKMACKHVSDPRPKATLCVPLIASGELIGSLHLAGDQKLDADLLQRTGAAAEQFALAIANLELRETLRNQSIRDPLTGLFNRRYTEATLQREIARAARDEGPLSLMLLDVDHFKRFNDEHGHDVGDAVLKQLGALLAAQTRGSDVASRLGGEELLVILPGANLEAGRLRAEQIRLKVSEVVIRAQGKVVGPVTVSIGLSAYPDHGSTPEELMKAADDALYRAKHEGRNRVLAAE